MTIGLGASDEQSVEGNVRHPVGHLQPTEPHADIHASLPRAPSLQTRVLPSGNMKHLDSPILHFLSTTLGSVLLLIHHAAFV